MMTTKIDLQEDEIKFNLNYTQVWSTSRQQEKSIKITEKKSSRLTTCPQGMTLFRQREHQYQHQVISKQVRQVITRTLIKTVRQEVEEIKERITRTSSEKESKWWWDWSSHEVMKERNKSIRTHESFIMKIAREERTSLIRIIEFLSFMLQNERKKWQMEHELHHHHQEKRTQFNKSLARKNPFLVLLRSLIVLSLNRVLLTSSISSPTLMRPSLKAEPWGCSPQTKTLIFFRSRFPARDKPSPVWPFSRSTMVTVPSNSAYLLTSLFSGVFVGDVVIFPSFE